MEETQPAFFSYSPFECPDKPLLKDLPEWLRDLGHDGASAGVCMKAAKIWAEDPLDCNKHLDSPEKARID